MDRKQIRIVILSGFRGCGKDTFANAMKGFVRISFADKLRQSCSMLFGIPMDDFTDRDKKEKPISSWPYISPRDILIRFGTDAARKGFDDEIWIRLAVKTMVDEISNGNLDFVISDARFVNETNVARYLAEELECIGKGDDYCIMHRVVRILREPMTRECAARIMSMHESDSGFLFMKPTDTINNFGDIKTLQWTAECFADEGSWIIDNGTVDTGLK